MKKYFSISFTTVLVLSLLLISNSALAIVLPISPQGPYNSSSASNDSSNGASQSWFSEWSGHSLSQAGVSIDSHTTGVNLGHHSDDNTSEYLKLTSYNFSIPTGSSITGISVQLTRSAQSTNTVKDEEVKLISTSVSTSSKADTSIYWPTSLASKTYGSSSDTWGRTWTPSEINNSNFGIILSAKNFDSSSKSAHVDGATITIYFKQATTITITPPSSDIPYGTAFSANATVSPTGVTGNIDIKEGSTVLGSATIAGGVGTVNIGASSSASNLPVGSHSIIGVYNGDGNYNTSTSSPASTINIVKASTNIEITNTTELATATYTKHPYTVEWNVSPSLPGGSGTPTGTVTISGGSECTADVSVGECDITSTEAGEKTLVATYSGDSNFTGNISADILHEVLEDTAPIISTHEDITGVEATSNEGATVDFTVNSTDVPDGILPAVCTPSSGSKFPLGETTVTCNKTDSVGNEATPISFKVIVVDTKGPVVTLNGNNPFDIYINTDYSTINPDPDYSSIDAYDGPVTPVIIGKDFDNTILGSHTITYSATDSHSNNTTVTRIVNVVDRNKPIIYRTGGSPLTIEGGSTYTDQGATAVDRDGSDITSSIVKVNPVNSSIVGTYTVTYDVTGATLGDLTGTNIADQAKRIVNVVDTTAPIITVEPLITHVLVGAPYDIKTGVSATDIINGNLTSSVTTGGTYSGTSTAGEYTITYNVADTAGNHATEVTRNIFVDEPDTTVPTISSVKAIAPKTIEVIFSEALQNNLEGHHPTVSDFIVYNDKNKSGNHDEGDISYNIDNVTYLDNKVTITLTDSLKSGDTPRLYVNPILTSLVDISGNYFNHGNSYDTNIVDKINPVLTLNGSNPDSITQGSSYIDPGATVTDIFDNQIIVNSNSNLNINLPGTYTITYNTTDNAGNIASQISRTVNVIQWVTSSHGGGGYLPGYGPSGSSTTSATNTTSGGQVLGASKFFFTENMHIGSRGNEVTQLQIFLNARGFNCGEVDGTYGMKTMLAVVKFQVTYNLKADGIIGPLTRAILNML